MADEVEREITVPVPPDEAWTLVTDAEELQRWLAPDGDPSIVEISVDPEEDGSRIRVSERPVVEPVAAIGVVLEFPVSRTRGPLALAA